MYCYYIDHKTSGKSEAEFARLSEGLRYSPLFASLSVVKLLTCHRIEIYSMMNITGIDFLNFNTIQDEESIYLRFSSIVSGMESKILGEDAILIQCDSALKQYNKDDALFKLLSRAFISGIEFRIKHNLFNENHGTLALNFILKNYNEKEAIIYIGSGSLVHKVVHSIKNVFLKSYIVTRNRHKDKGFREGLHFLAPEDLKSICAKLDSYALFISTTNVDESYLETINYASDQLGCKIIGNLNSVELGLKLNSNIPYIDMYNTEMGCMIEELNNKTKLRIYNHN